MMQCCECYTQNAVKLAVLASGIQLYLCRNPDCLYDVFILDTSGSDITKRYRGQIVEMILSRKSVREISDVLELPTDVVIQELEKLLKFF